MKILFLFIFLIIFINSAFALCESGQININTASAEDLDKITNIGPKTAIKVIDAKPFSSVDDLIRISGIGNITLNEIKIQGLACVSGEEISSSNETNFQIEEEPREEQISSQKLSNLKIAEEVYEDEPELKTIFLSNNNQSETMNLNPKTIKTGENSSFQGKEKYIYLLLGFCILLVILYLIQNKGKTKNEFR